MDCEIISFELKKKQYKKKECKHIRIVIDEPKWLIECADCGIQLDPIWYLKSLADKEKMFEFRCNQLKQAYDEVEKKLKSRIKTKCSHYGKMTNIKGV